MHTQGVPPDLVFFADETGQYLCPAPQRTLALQGSVNVPVFGSGDKRAVTVMIAGNFNGQLLPAQMIFKGTRNVVLPTKNDHPDKIFFSKNPASHWASVETTLEFLQRIVDERKAYCNTHKKNPRTTRSLIVWDVFSCHRNVRVLEFCKKHNICVLFVPANTTGFLQVMDVAVNRPWKHSVEKEYVRHCIDRTLDPDQADAGLPKIGDLRNHLVEFVATAYDHITAIDAVTSGIRKIGLQHALEQDWIAHAQRRHNDGTLWNSISKKDSVVVAGTIDDPALYAADCAVADAEEDEALHMDEDPPEPTPLEPLSLPSIPTADEVLQLLRQGQPQDEPPTPPTAPAPPAPPRKRPTTRYCQSCLKQKLKRSDHRADNRNCPNYHLFLSKKN